MTNPDHERLTRTGRWAPHFPTAQENAELIARQREREQQALEHGLTFPPMGWPEIAAWVDENVWTRLLNEHRDTWPDEYKRMVAIRPPAQNRLGDG